MTKTRFLLALAALMLGMTAYGQQDRKKDKIIIFNGYFFNEMPAIIKKAAAPKDMRMFVISTPGGTKAAAISAPSLKPDEETLRYAIPAEKIPEGAELLRRYNEQKEEGAGFSFGIKQEAAMVKAGDKFPDFTATDINGRTWTNADVAGKVMVLNLWYTGCGPCRREMPELAAWKDEMPDVMFFSSTYEAPEVARPVLEQTGFNWTALVNDRQFKKYIGGKGYPLTIIVDKDGKIAACEYGTSPEQRAALKGKIAELR